LDQADASRNNRCAKGDKSVVPATFSRISTTSARSLVAPPPTEFTTRRRSDQRLCRRGTLSTSRGCRPQQLSEQSQRRASLQVSHRFCVVVLCLFSCLDDLLSGPACCRYWSCSCTRIQRCRGSAPSPELCKTLVAFRLCRPSRREEPCRHHSHHFSTERTRTPWNAHGCTSTHSTAAADERPCRSSCACFVAFCALTLGQAGTASCYFIGSHLVHLNLCPQSRTCRSPNGTKHPNLRPPTRPPGHPATPTNLCRYPITFPLLLAS